MESTIHVAYSDATPVSHHRSMQGAVAAIVDHVAERMALHELAPLSDAERAIFSSILTKKRWLNLNASAKMVQCDIPQERLVPIATWVARALHIHLVPLLD